MLILEMPHDAQTAMPNARGSIRVAIVEDRREVREGLAEATPVGSVCVGGDRVEGGCGG